MSERSVEDELADEGRKFLHAMRAALSHHAQATTWLERRRVRKLIKRSWREELRRQDADRANQLTWTQQSIDRYRAHSLAVAQRANDPTVDHTRRARDAHALAEHADDLRARFVTNGRLTEVERGIALDGIDAATTWPDYEPGQLFARAHKVKGIDALQYRAHLARTARDLGIDRDAVRHGYSYHQPRTQALAEQVRTQPTRTADRPYEAWLTWRTHEGVKAITTDRFASQDAALEWVRGSIGRSEWSPSATLTAEIQDRNGRWAYQRAGTPDQVRDQVEQSLRIARETTVRKAGETRPDREPPEGEPRLRVVKDAAPQPDRPGPDQERTSRPESAVASESGRAEGAPDTDRLAALERKVAVLQRGLDAVTTDRDALREQLTEAQAREDRLKNRNLRLAAELDQRPDQQQTLDKLFEAIDDRDRYKRERDQAVAKLAERTHPADRYGSRERQADQHRGGDQPPDTSTPTRSQRTEGEHTQPWPRPHDTADRTTETATRNNNGRNGYERSR
ncbi:hypothetical protein [Nocardia puris]|uniref:hypothetical protein n=1 Tax=Nocardia puris TaxID=208602 RepID=UPI002E241652